MRNVEKEIEEYVNHPNMKLGHKLRDLFDNYFERNGIKFVEVNNECWYDWAKEINRSFFSLTIDQLLELNNEEKMEEYFQTTDKVEVDFLDYLIWAEILYSQKKE